MCNIKLPIYTRILVAMQKFVSFFSFSNLLNILYNNKILQNFAGFVTYHFVILSRSFGVVSESISEKLKRVQLDKREKRLLRFLHVLRQNVNILVFYSSFNKVCIVPNQFNVVYGSSTLCSKSSSFNI